MQEIDEIIEISQDIDLGIDAGPEQIVYFDIETTGFSPLTTHLYLIGAIYVQGHQYHIHQWFAEDTSQEADLLNSFFDFLKDKKALVHFNGTGFDIPYIIKKCRQLHVSCDFNHMASIDLYKLVSPLKSILKIANLKQKTIEEFLGINRDDTMNGGELIEVYESYIRDSDEEKRKLLLLHNHDDVIGMMQILPIIHYTGLSTGGYHIISTLLQESKDYSGMSRTELILELALDRFLPKRISFGNNCFYCTAGGDTAKLCIQVYTDELKYFYPNYKDYYYLPAEDRSIHKSVAFYVDKEFRTKAKAANCYSKKTGTFLPQFEDIISPYFKIDYYDKMSYFEYTEEFRQDDGQMMDYINHIFRVLIHS